MWSVISRLVVKLAALRWLFKLGGLSLLLPIAFLLKVVGIPLLIVLAIVGLPIIMLLFLFGLPIFAVLLVGGLLMGLLGFVLTIGVAAVKIAIFVVLPIWLMWKLFHWLFHRGDGKGDAGGDATPTTPPTPSTPTPDPVDTGTGFDPAI